MTALAAVLAVSAAAAAVANWLAVGRGWKTGEYVAKPLTMLLLVGFAATVEPAVASRQIWFVVAGVFCLAGDVFLMLPRDRFVPGLAAFLVGHVCYVAGFVTGGALNGAAAVAGIVAVAVAVVAIGRPVLAAVRRDHPALLVPVAGYLVVISAMVVAAFAAGPALAVAGALLFYASDSIIAWRRFLHAPAWAPVAIMVTYHLAQFALVGSLTIAA